MTYFIRGFLLLFAVTFGARTFWYGKPMAVNCELAHTGQIDCTLTSKALLRSWNRHIAGVKNIQVDHRVYHTESDTGERNYSDYYIVVLQAQGREYPVKTYSYSNDPELEIWRHRINQFTESPRSGLSVSVHYNPWQPILTAVLVIFYIVLATIIPVIFVGLISLFFLCIVSSIGTSTGFKFRSLISDIRREIIKITRS